VTQILLVLASVFCASIPMFFFLLTVWWLDRYDREPVWLVGLTFLWGAVGAVGLAIVGSLVLMVPLNMVLSSQWASSAGAVFIAPLVEEPMKAAILLLVMLSRHFDNTTDGFVYGAAAGLGFGMTENFLYFTGVAMSGSVIAWCLTVVIRTFFSAVMHAVATSIVGACLGAAKFRPFYFKILLVPLGLAVAMTVHGIWNGLLTADDLMRAGGALAGLDLLLFPLEFIVVFVVFQICLLDEHYTIKRELTEEARMGTIPLEHVKHLASYFRRGFRFWHSRQIPHGAYIKAATRLALRRHQSRYAGSWSRPFYTQEVERWRAEIRRLLGPAALRTYGVEPRRE
jgi:RsiW-degrading membrane proteinase PrsW (M82 family)